MKNLIKFLLLAIMGSPIVGGAGFCYAQQAGSLDVSFDGDGSVITTIGSSLGGGKVLVLPDGKILLAGIRDYSAFNGIFNFAFSTMVFVRYNQNGSIDNTFDGDGKAAVVLATNIDNGLESRFSTTFGSVALQADGKIVAVAITKRGSFFNFRYSSIIRLNTNGSVDNSFSGDGVLKNTDLATLNNLFEFTDVAIQSNGKIVVAGHADNKIAVCRFNSDSNLDLGFDADGLQMTDVGGVSNYSSLAIQPDNKIIVSNGFKILRYTSSGTLDTSFDEDGLKTPPQISGYFLDSKSILIQPDGKIVVAGLSNGNSYNNVTLIRYNINGSIDFSFDNDGVVITGDPSPSPLNLGLESIFLQPDGKIIASGYKALIRYNTNGTLDNTFETGGDGIIQLNTVEYTAIQTDGKIVACGNNSSYFEILRIHGVSNFNSNNGKMYANASIGADVANAIVVRPNGKIITAGFSFNAVNGTSNKDFAIIAYNADGSLDYTFGNNAIAKTDINTNSNDIINAIALQTDGKIVVAGTTTANASTNTNIVIARYLADGSNLDVSFGVGGKTIIDLNGTVDNVTCLALHPNGTILVGGNSELGATTQFILARFNATGGYIGTNTTLISIGANKARAIAIQADGKILLAGQVGTDFAILRYQTSGTLLDNTFDGDGLQTTTFGAFSTDEGYGMVIQPDGKILVSGNSNINGTADFAMVRYNTDGSVDNTFGTSGKALVDFGDADFFPSVGLLPNGKILLVGQSFITSFGIACFNANGTLDTSFDTDGKLELRIGNIRDVPTSMVIQPDGRVLVAGYYDNGTTLDFALVKLLPLLCYSGSLTLVSPTNNYPNINLPNIQEAKNIIASNEIFNSPLAIIYIAAKSITLSPGFKVNNGAVFKTEIQTCGN